MIQENFSPVKRKTLEPQRCPRNSLIYNTLRGGRVSPETLGVEIRVSERCPPVKLLWCWSAFRWHREALLGQLQVPSGKFSGRSHALAMEVNSISQSVSLNTVQTLEILLVQVRSQIVKYLPQHLDADNMIYVALKTVRADS